MDIFKMSNFKKFENYFFKKKNHFFQEFYFVMYYGAKNEQSKKWDFFFSLNSFLIYLIL